MVSLEAILDSANMMTTFRQVIANKGAPGVDDMRTDELESYIRAHPKQLSQAIADGSYRPSPLRRVYIPKENGEQRPLGIPTVIDRLVQQAIAQVLSAEYEPKFSPYSYAYRPYRSAEMAALQVKQHADEGREWVVALDLSKFFDTVNHSKMMQVLSDTIKDGRVISLIHRFFRAKICDGGKYTKPSCGMPQGGPLSPVCANILLNELDQELTRRGHKFVRYADDLLLMCGSKKAAERAYVATKKYVEEKLFLKVNETKTKVCRLSDGVKYLGFGFYKKPEAKWEKWSGGVSKWALTVHPKKLSSFKKRVKVLLDRRCPRGLERTKEEFAAYIRGWTNYFWSGLSKGRKEKLDRWIRRHIRQLYWKIWKKTSTKEAALRKLGMKPTPAHSNANSSKSYWRIAGSWVLTTTMTNDKLEELGWIWPGNAMS